MRIDKDIYIISNYSINARNTNKFGGDSLDLTM